MTVETFRANRKALSFGTQKLNLHEAGHEFKPKANKPTAGPADLCFISATPLGKVIAHLEELNIPIEEGPIEKTGATGYIMSVYIRDPDKISLKFRTAFRPL